MESNLERAKSFLNRNSTRLALRAVPLAILATAAIHALPSGPAKFNAPNDSTVDYCSGGGTPSVVAPLSGVPVNGGQGISLSGTGRVSNSSGGDCVYMEWDGTGSGVFSTATLPLKFQFSLSGSSSGNPDAQPNVRPHVTSNGVTYTEWYLDIYINPSYQYGAQAYTRIPLSKLARKRVSKQGLEFLPRKAVDYADTYIRDTSGGTSFNVTNQTFNVPNGAAFVDYEVDLEADYTFSGNSATVTLTVPGATSIDLNPPSGPVAPAPPGLLLVGTGIAAMLLLLYARRRRELA